MNLFFRKFGQGPPLIIIHGLYGSSDNWFTIGKKLSENFEVYLIDQRNHGQSSHSEEHNYLLLKEDLKEFMDQQSIEKAIIIGHSMGGKTAMFFSADYPERITSLIIVDISPLSYLTTNSVQLLQHKTILDSMFSIDLSNVASREQVDEILSKSIPQKYIRQFLLKNLNRSKDNSFSWGINIPVLRKKLPEIIDGLNLQDFENKKTITGFPVLFIKGENSDYILEKDSKAIEKIYPYAEIETIENAGHWVHAEQPEHFLQKITNFLL
jgi:esterase